MPKCLILQGIPTSGKSTWAKKHQLISSMMGESWCIISCDEIRKTFNNKKYKFNKQIEDKVWDHFYKLVERRALLGNNIIIDNTNLKQAYINTIAYLLPDNYTVQIKCFPISLPKAYIRNYIRWIKTGKWIPLKVIKTMYKNYKKINNAK